MVAKKMAIAITGWINTSIMKSSKGEDNSTFFSVPIRQYIEGYTIHGLNFDYHKNFLASVKRRHREKGKRGKISIEITWQKTEGVFATFT